MAHEKVVSMTIEIIWFLLLVIIGAVIGGGTNILAIRMLFRPHLPFYIGRFRVPFTPGLVPKRRQEIAEQLGKMVEEHLVTPEGIESKLFEGSIAKEAEKKMMEAIDSITNDEKTLNEWVADRVGDRWSTVNATEAYETAIKKKMMTFINHQKSEKLKDIMPEDWIRKAEDQLPRISSQILLQVDLFLNSDEGEAALDHLADRFFETKGSFGGIIGKVASRFQATKLLSNELTKFVRDKHAERLLNELLKKELEKVLESRLEEFINENGLEEKVDEVVSLVIQQTPVISEWERPLNQWSYKYRTILSETFVPKLMETVTYLAKKYVRTVITKLGIGDIVRQQVNNFPLSRLEEMLLNVAKKELKMIAVLGAIVGGGIGGIQGIIIFFLL